MLSRSSFEAELTAFRTGVKSSKRREMIDRWITDCRQSPRSEEVWAQIRGVVPAPDFIRAVLNAWQHAAAMADCMFGVRSNIHRLTGWAEWLRDLRDRLDVLLSKSDVHPLVIAEILESAAEEARYEFAHRFEGPLPQFGQKEGSKITHARKLLIQGMIEYFVETIDRPFLDGVATLTEIALPGQALSVKDIENATRPTTKRGRSKARR